MDYFQMKLLDSRRAIQTLVDKQDFAGMYVGQDDAIKALKEYVLLLCRTNRKDGEVDHIVAGKPQKRDSLLTEYSIMFSGHHDWNDVVRLMCEKKNNRWVYVNTKYAVNTSGKRTNGTEKWFLCLKLSYGYPVKVIGEIPPELSPIKRSDRIAELIKEHEDG